MTEPDQTEPEDIELPDEPEPLDGAALVAAEDAEDDDSDLDDRQSAIARRNRLAPIQDRLLVYLRDVGEEWRPWPEVVEAVQARPLAEISPRSGRVRQAALALSKQGRVEIKYGRTTVFDAVRLAPTTPGRRSAPGGHEVEG